MNKRDLTLKGSSVIVGDDMEAVKECYVIVRKGRIARISGSKPARVKNLVKLEGCAIAPGFVNAHVHLGDAGFKDAGFGLGLNQLFKPPNGLKHKLLSTHPDEYLVKAMKSALLSMVKSGITLFADFREGGIRGVELLVQALREVRIKGVILGRVNYAFSSRRLRANKGGYPRRALKELRKLVRVAHGVAPSSPNELTDDALKQYAKAARSKLRATHASENPKGRAISIKRTGLTEVERALTHLRPSFLVHLTYATEEEIAMVRDREIPVVCCPRANASLGLKLPPLPKLSLIHI